MRFFFAFSAACVLLDSISTLPAAEPASLVVREQPAVRADFAGLAGEGAFRFVTDGQTVRVPREKLLTWGAPANRIETPCLMLTDGSRLVATVQRVNEGSFAVESETWRLTDIPRNAARGILFVPSPRALDLARQLDELASHEAVTDGLRLTNGDALEGRLVSESESDEASIFGIERLSIEPMAGQDAITIPSAEVTALLLAGRPAEQPEACACVLVGLRDGSLLKARRFERVERDVALTLCCGVRLVATGDAFRAQTVFLQPIGKGVRYLSDAEPLAYRHVPFLQLDQPLGRDRNVLGGWLSAGGRNYPKGIGMHGTSRVVFDIEPGEVRFESELAIDAAAEGQGSVVFRLFLERPGADAGSTWETAYQSPLIRGDEPPLPMRVELGDAKRIALVTEFADRADVGDYADWLNARLVRQAE